LKFIELGRYLQKLLKKKVEFVDKQEIKPQLKEMIMKEVIYI